MPLIFLFIIRLIQKVEQQIENSNSEGGPGQAGAGMDGSGAGNGADKGAGGGSSQHITSVDEKKQRV